MMDKIQKIREEVERIINRRLNLINGDYFDLNEETSGFTNEIMNVIGSFQEEPVSKDLEEAAKNHAVERYRITRNMVLAEKCKWSYITGAKWLFKKVKEALLSEVLPCFMHGGEADEVVAKLDEVLNQK